ACVRRVGYYIDWNIVVRKYLRSIAGQVFVSVFRNILFNLVNPRNYANLRYSSVLVASAYIYYEDVRRKNLRNISVVYVDRGGIVSLIVNTVALCCGIHFVA